ncbi:hypothetical protein ACSQ67_016341 [Phaseolus vulgaris]
MNFDIKLLHTLYGTRIKQVCLLGGEGGACKNNHCGKKFSSDGVGGACSPNSGGVFSSFLGNEESNKCSGAQLGGCGKRELHFNDALINQKWSDDLICVGPILAQERVAARVDSSLGAAAATMYVFSGEVADQEVTRGVAVCDGTDNTSGSDASDEDAQHNGGFRSSSRDVYEATITNGGVLYMDLCAATGGDQLATPVSALGVAATIGDDSLGRNGDELRCEGTRVINGRDDGAFLQYGDAVEDGRRSFNGSSNAVLISSTSNSGDSHKVDGRLASCVFNQAPMVNARGTGSQAGVQMEVSATFDM